MMNDRLRQRGEGGGQDDGAAADPLSSLDDSVSQQLSELMSGSDKSSRPSMTKKPAARKHLAPPRKPSKKPMKLGATKRASRGGGGAGLEDDGDGWGDLLNS